MDASSRLGERILRHRLLAVFLVGAATAFFAYHTAHLRLGPAAGVSLLPGIPFRQAEETSVGPFLAGRPSLTIMVAARSGSIFTVDALNRIRGVTAALAHVKGIDARSVESIAAASARRLKTGPGGTLRAQPVMSGPIATTDDAEAIRRVILSSDYLRPLLVAADGSAAVIRAQVIDARLDYGRLFADIRDRVVAPYRDDDVEISVAGEAMLFAWAHAYAPATIPIFVATVLLLWTLLAVSLHDWRAALRPTVSAALAAVWGLGVLQLIGGRLDPLLLMIPVFLTARAVSHAVHHQQRFAAAYDRSGDVHTAVVDAFAAGCAPLLGGIVIDACAVLSIVPVAGVERPLAVAGACWIAAVAVGEMVLTPILFAWLPPARGVSATPPRFLVRSATAVLGRRGRRAAALLVLVALLASADGWHTLLAGEGVPAPVMSTDAPYARARSAIEDKLGGLDRLVVVADGYDRDAMKDPETLRGMERLQRHIERDPAVAASVSLADIVRALNADFHEHEPKWGVIPNDAAAVGGLLAIFFSGAPPGEMAKAVDPTYRTAPLIFLCRDLNAETVQRIATEAARFSATLATEALGITVADAPDGGVFVTAVRDVPGWTLEGNEWVAGRTRSGEGPFQVGDRLVAVGDRRLDSAADFQAALADEAARSPNLAFTVRRGARSVRLAVRAPWKAVFRLAGEAAGIPALTRLTPAGRDVLIVALGLAAVYVGLLIACRSFVASAYLLMPIAIANLIAQAYLGARHLIPSALPFVMVGVAFGVDSVLYLRSQLRVERARTGDLPAALGRAVASCGHAVLIAAGSMTAAMLLWTASGLRFQAEMGCALAVWIAASAVAALGVLPAAIAAFEPRFATQPARPED
jgi:predicted RND superfamily exporter protein